MKKKARIILDRYEPRTPSWNWRDDWYTNYDSTYSLFAKFAFLNAFAARDLVHIFISTDSGMRTKVLRNPQVDLRDPSYFDIPAMSIALRADIDTVSQSFLYAMLPNGQRKSVAHLRWCTRCAAIGFHSPLFQLEIISNCPIHARPLRATCPHCNSRIPYQLRKDVVDVPFACSSCKADFAPVLRNPRTRSLRLSENDIACMRNLTDLLKFEDQLIPRKLELNRLCKMQGSGEVVIAPADVRRHHSQFTGFVMQVLDEVRAEVDTAQIPLALTEVTQVIRGNKATPMHGIKLKKRRKRNEETILSHNEIKKDWGDMLVALHTVYCAIRRRIWRRLIASHQHCVVCAARRLWWHMEGENTPSFCPIAEAFLRWRMFWEGCGVPGHLLGPLTKPPFGIVGWQAQTAPICPQGWSRETEIWVTQHIFARACMSSYDDWMAVSTENHEIGHIQWTKHATSGRFESYWALTGHDSWHKPVRIYIQSEDIDRRSLVNFASKDHYQGHYARLLQLKR